MKTSKEDRENLRKHAIKGTLAPRTTCMVTAELLLRILDDLEALDEPADHDDLSEKYNNEG